MSVLCNIMSSIVHMAMYLCACYYECAVQYYVKYCAYGHVSMCLLLCVCCVVLCQVLYIWPCIYVPVIMCLLCCVISSIVHMAM